MIVRPHAQSRLHLMLHRFISLPINTFFLHLQKIIRLSRSSGRQVEVLHQLSEVSFLVFVIHQHVTAAVSDVDNFSDIWRSGLITGTILIIGQTVTAQASRWSWRWMDLTSGHSCMNRWCWLAPVQVREEEWRTWTERETYLISSAG